MSRMVGIISGPELIQDGLTQRGKVSSGLTSPHVKYFLKSWRWWLFEREKEQCKVQKPASVTVCGFVSACGMGNLHSIKAPLRFWNIFFAVQMTTYLQRHPCLFQQDHTEPHSACFTQHGLKEWAYKACLLSRHVADTDTMWPIMKCKIWRQPMESVESLNANFKTSTITVKNTYWVLKEKGEQDSGK